MAMPCRDHRSAGSAHTLTALPQARNRALGLANRVLCELEEVGASLKWATAKVERASQRGNGDRAQGRERAAERGGDFNDPPPF
jgi:hypothetical protein